MVIKVVTTFLPAMNKVEEKLRQAPSFFYLNYWEYFKEMLEL